MTVSSKLRAVLLTGVVGFIGLQAADKLTALGVATARAIRRENSNTLRFAERTKISDPAATSRLQKTCLTGTCFFSHSSAH